MGSKWNNGSRDIGGILRKTNQITVAENEQRLGELLVFGYACKIFRDDDKARYIDQGKHLIPWMGDESLKIDRYDVRAALPDITLYEPPPGGYTNRMDYLTPAEQRAEQLCEEERYYSLYNNEEDEQMYQEEELKRLHREGATSYGQVQFDYNTPNAPEVKAENNEKLEEPDEAFSPPQNFMIPASIVTPETMKQHAIIERTAKFISTQGPQMEILIKAKQSNNPQFEFLIQNNKLNPYYKFVLNAFKIGTYPEQTATKAEEKNPSPEPELPIDRKETTIIEPPPPPHPHTVFIHPSTIRIPTIKYKPSADCAYTQLISKIKGVPIPQEVADDSNKHEVVEESAPSLYYSSYYTTSYAADNEEYYATDESAVAIQQTEEATPKEENGVQIKKISSGLMLAQCYASDTEDESEADDVKSYLPEHFTIPPESLQNIVDKTAIYVAKNGKQFEDILRSKQDERFTFLDPSDEFYPYYLHKVIGLNSSYVPSRNGDGKYKGMTTVSFSIKSKDDSSVPINPALLQETSDDDDPEGKAKSAVANQQNQSTNGTAEKPSIPVPSPNALIAAATAARISAAIAIAKGGNNNNNAASARTRFDIDNTGSVVNRSNASVAASATGATTATNKSETTHQKELKRAEEKVKDRLALIAREKLGLISKEKQLQLERKKRAMMFLNQIKGSGSSQPTGSSPNDSTTPPLNTYPGAKSLDSNDDSDVSSVHSIPISSYQNDDDEGVEDEISNRRSKSIECIDLSDVKNCENSPQKVEIIEIIDNDNEIDTTLNHRSNRKRGRDRNRDDARDQESKRHRSRSRTKESSSHTRHKKKKSKHSKKKSKKRSRSRSPSAAKNGSRDKSRDKQHSKRSNSLAPAKKSKKKKKSRTSRS